MYIDTVVACMVLGEGDAVYDAWLFSFHMHRLVAAESEHLGGTA